MRFFALVFLVAALAGCNDAPAEGRCDELIDHLVELEVKAAGIDDEAKRADLAKKLDDEIGERVRSYCNDELPSAQVECALKATSREAVDACDAR